MSACVGHGPKVSDIWKQMMSYGKVREASASFLIFLKTVHSINKYK